ncbi:NusG domain II-containing protein [Pelosinus baikalensis]|uniref:NusG domain II-containing protein n=1 Tax=Pelosinus baikalensis TaxID=2892015 RepID=A0ABS8HPZ8_9FIRM|nr:NusG domain II-containing protein [Pelosinus baikalensis]MCC5463854.1 NusG domain II-containing protein [Pelosinus baikalensis]
MMKKIGLTLGDKWLIGMLCVVSFTGIILSVILFPAQANTVAEIRVDNKLFKSITLRQGYYEEFRIGGDTEYAIIEVQDGKIRIRQDDSPRQIGVQTGWISKPPQQVVNLPYRIVIHLVSNESLDVDDIAR